MNLIGALLISIEAMGATKFLQAVKSDEKIACRMAQLGFVSAINTISIFVLVWIVSFVILWLLERKFDIVFDLVAAPFGFAVWRLAIKIADWLARFTKLLAPPKNLHQRGCLLLILSLFWGLAWAVVFGIASLIYMVIRFAIDLPLRFLGEKVIGAMVMRLFERIDQTVSEMQRWYFKKPVFIGALLLIGGFIYQIIGTVLIILTET